MILKQLSAHFLLTFVLHYVGFSDLNYTSLFHIVYFFLVLTMFDPPTNFLFLSLVYLLSCCLSSGLPIPTLVVFGSLHWWRFLKWYQNSCLHIFYLHLCFVTFFFPIWIDQHKGWTYSFLHEQYIFSTSVNTFILFKIRESINFSHNKLIYQTPNQISYRCCKALSLLSRIKTFLAVKLYL